MKKLLIVITLTAALNCPVMTCFPGIDQTHGSRILGTYIPSAWLFRALIVQ